jgi:hypothetical protein
MCNPVKFTHECKTTVIGRFSERSAEAANKVTEEEKLIKCSWRNDVVVRPGKCYALPGINSEDVDTMCGGLTTKDRCD